MNGKLYDNGTILLGAKKDIINYMNNAVNLDEEDKEEILDFIKDFNDNDIIAINYDCGMGLSMDAWTENDILKGWLYD